MDFFFLAGYENRHMDPDPAADWTPGSPMLSPDLLARAARLGLRYRAAAPTQLLGGPTGAAPMQLRGGGGERPPCSRPDTAPAREPQLRLLLLLGAVLIKNPMSIADQLKKCCFSSVENFK